MTVIVEYQIKVVDDEKVRDLYNQTLGNGSDLVEVPGLPGVTFQNIRGISKGWGLELENLQNDIAVATKGETPSAIILVKAN